MKIIMLMFALAGMAAAAAQKSAAEGKPHIIVILADDLGYGDVRCLNPERGKIPTPSIDRLATHPNHAGEDSVSLMPLLRGADKPVRETLVHHSINGNFALRDGRWKLVFCPGSGGWSSGPKSPPVQLYDMSADKGERKNLHAEYPDVVKRLTAKLETLVAEGRSTPGPKQKNAIPVDIFKKST